MVFISKSLTMYAITKLHHAVLLVTLLFGCVVMSSRGTAQVYWTNPGTGNWFDPVNWNLGVPHGSFTFIRNGGHAIVDTPGADTAYLFLGTSASEEPNFPGNLTVTGLGRLVYHNDIEVVQGTLLIQDGGIVDHSLIGNPWFCCRTEIGAGSPQTNAAAIVTGANSLLRSGGLDVGGFFSGGRGTLLIANGGRVESSSGDVTHMSTTTVAGRNSQWAIDGNLNVSNGSVMIADRGSVNARSSGIYSGTVTVTGTGSSFNNTQFNGALTIGSSGAGALNVQNGGLATSVTGIVGAGGSVFPGNGTVTVTGDGSYWENSGNLFVGGDGTTAYVGNGTLRIQNGGTAQTASIRVSNTGSVEVDNGSSAVSGLIVTRASAPPTLGGPLGDLTVALNSRGRMLISEGGVVHSGTGQIGRGVGQNGVVLVDGPGSQWTNSDLLLVGRFGNGTLTVRNRGRVSSAFARIGNSAGSTGAITVDGMTSAWTNTSDLSVGENSVGTLAVQNGGAVSSAEGNIGRLTSGSGTATVTGAGSQWTNSGDLNVGVSGNGSLVVQNGGTVASSTGQIGRGIGGIGSATVDGLDSNWTISDLLLVGRFGNGNLTIRNRGRVSSSFARIGNSAGSTGAVIVDGVGSAWANTNDISVGENSVGTLTIRNGGAVSSAVGNIGRLSSGSGMATVDGAGSNWTMTGELNVGHEGTGTLSVKNSGVVSAAGGVFVSPLSTLTGDGTIVGNLTNNGSIAPGNSLGTLHLTGDYSQGLASGTAELQIELASPTNFDRLDVTGNVMLGGGTLEVSLTGGYVPGVAESFDILDWTGTLSGAFTTLQLPTLAPGSTWDTSQLYTTGVLSVIGPGLPGDYNKNGVVDAADYAVWRHSVGQAGAGLAADGNGDNLIDGGDYVVWHAHFGLTAVGLNAFHAVEPEARPNAVPEPFALAHGTLLVALLLISWHRVRRFTPRVPPRLPVNRERFT
jgi:T5SS/PEP-CTERM-associated repeat protein